MQEIWAEPELIEATKAGIELWRPVVGSDEFYEVSNFGGVRSWMAASRHHGRRRRVTPKPISPTLNFPGGYLCVTIFEAQRRRYVPVHHLIAEAFICPRPGVGRAWEAGHHDDDRLSNRLDNIKWCTHRANNADRKRNGRVRRKLSRV